MKTDNKELTENQQENLDLLENWIKDDRTSACLIGGAGTGKTFLLKEFLKDKKDVIVSAPTHKAKNVISKVTDKNGETIQKLLGLRPDFELDTFDIDNVQFNILGEARMGDANLVVIDESSMLPAKLYEYIISSAKDFKTKVLFVGDRYQLPPIKESESLAFLNSDLKCELTKVIRQKDSNPTSELLAILREDVINKTNKFDNYIIANPVKYNTETNEGYCAYFSYDANETNMFSNIMIETFKTSEFKNSPDFCKYIAFTNESVKTTNSFIRTSIFTSNADFVQNGDILMAYKSVGEAVKDNKGRIQYFDELIINSEDYYVEDCVLASSMKIYGHKITIRNSKDIKRTVFIVNPSSYNEFVKQHDEYLQNAYDTFGKARKIAWQNYYAFKNYFLLLEDLTSSNNKKIAKDFDFSYGISVHKSQGSTYDHVFINVKDIYKNYKAEERKRLLYVAASRTSKTLHLFI